jgi:hypothetical protein
MNLVRHLQVLWRSKWIIVLGGIVAGALGVLAVCHVSWDGGPKLDWRKPETWTANAKLQITQNGFPDGRGVLPTSARTPETLPTPTNTTAAQAAKTAAAKKAAAKKAAARKRSRSKHGKRAKHGSRSTTSKPDDRVVPVVRTRFADPGRLAYLAWIYSHFLMSDQVRGMLPERPAGLDIEAVPLTAGGNLSSGALPLIFLSTSADTERGAEKLSINVTNALERYLADQQAASRVPRSERIGVVVVNESPSATRKAGHPLSVGVVAFLLTLAATLGLVYVLENIRLHRSASGGVSEKRVVPDGRSLSTTGERTGAR